MSETPVQVAAAVRPPGGRGRRPAGPAPDETRRTADVSGPNRESGKRSGPGRGHFATAAFRRAGEAGAADSHTSCSRPRAQRTSTSAAPSTSSRRMSGSALSDAAMAARRSSRSTSARGLRFPSFGRPGPPGAPGLNLPRSSRPYPGGCPPFFTVSCSPRRASPGSSVGPSSPSAGRRPPALRAAGPGRSAFRGRRRSRGRSAPRR